MPAPRSPVRFLLGAFTPLLLACACRTVEAQGEVETRTPQVVAERAASVVVLTTELAPDGSLRAPTMDPASAAEPLPAAALPVAVRRDGAQLACRRHADGPPIHYLVFERSGDAAAYGVYGLFGPKNDLPVSRPLSGDTVQWPGLDHEAALRRQLRRVGVDDRRADALLEGRRATWFGEGLRVFFVLDAEEAARLGAAGPAPRAALLRVELPGA